MMKASSLRALKLDRVFRSKYGDPVRAGWSPRQNYRFGYFTPDDYYEALLDELVQPDTRWLDVGGGRSLLPSNPGLARVLAARCATLVGVDPSETLAENPYVHRQVRCGIEEYRTEEVFDLATLRMVAEHLREPQAMLAALARLLCRGGQVVVYTVHSWSPMALLARAVPFRLHHPLKRLFWGTEEKDTFPVVYRMNTRRQLRQLFEASGFVETSFAYLDDCRTFHRSRVLSLAELSLWRALRTVRLHYLDTCLLGVYEKQ